MATLADTGEHLFIRAIRDRYPMELAGDDAAGLPPLETPVITTDSFLEGTHFHRKWAAPDVIARRLLEATLSDLAAMGAFPEYLLSSLFLPPEMSLEWMLEFYRGLTARNDCPVAGGETVRGSVFGVSLTALGNCRGERPFLRRNARPGDSLWITGPLGRSFRSPELLDRDDLSQMESEHVHLFLNPRARFDCIPALRLAGARAAIDVSDGLFSECGHLSRESGVCVVVELDRVPLVKYCRGKPMEACTAGEDFELLFTLPPGSRLEEGYFRIGSVIPGSGIRVLINGEETDIPADQGYDHFSGRSRGGST